MNKSNINVPSAGTEADSSTTAENHHVSQPNANTNVVGSLFKSREIKFRAFDDGKMIYPTNALSNLNRFFRVIREDCKLMQYTGLKDCKGKEIYEGDILKCSKNHNYYRQVVFSNGNYWLVNPDRLMNFELQVILSSHIDSVVVGNVFENPELSETLR